MFNKNLNKSIKILESLVLKVFWIFLQGNYKNIIVIELCFFFCEVLWKENYERENEINFGIFFISYNLFINYVFYL